MAADWHVTSVDTRPDIAPNGRLINVKEVHFRVDTDPGAGHEDMVTVSEDRFTPDAVRALIDDKVARIKAVVAL